MSHSGMGMIASGAADTVLCGGCETMSDVPLRLSRNLRHKLLQVPAGDRLGTGWGPAGDRLGTGWGPAGDRLGTGWGPAGDRLGTGWGPAGDRLGTAGGDYPLLILIQIPACWAAVRILNCQHVSQR